MKNYKPTQVIQESLGLKLYKKYRMSKNLSQDEMYVVLMTLKKVDLDTDDKCQEYLDDYIFNNKNLLKLDKISNSSKMFTPYHQLLGIISGYPVECINYFCKIGGFMNAPFEDRNIINEALSKIDSNIQGYKGGYIPCPKNAKKIIKHLSKEKMES